MNGTPGWPMDAAYAAAARLLRERMEALGRTSPDPIPLRLREEEGLLLSALARQAGDGGEALARELAEGLGLEGTPFCRAEARRGLLLLHFSQGWLEEVLGWYTRLPWPEERPAAGVLRQDRNNPAFLCAYTLARCKALARREPGEQTPLPLPVGLICLLARGPGRARERWAAEVARRYGSLPAQVRRGALLAGAVGRAMGLEPGGCFTKNSPTPHFLEYNNKNCCISPGPSQGEKARETRRAL